MIIILEGADCVGKTSFAHRLQATFAAGADVRTLHRGAPTADVVNEYTDDLLNYVPTADRSEPHYVLDRWHWGEEVYGPLYRGKSGFTNETFDVVERFLRDRGAFVVLLEADPKEIRRRMKETKEDFLQPEHVPYVLNEYAKLARKSRLPVLRYENPMTFDALTVISFGMALQSSAARAWGK